ncbi:MAG: nucleotide kinase-like protein [Candidatus Aramenus sulfurataquae]|jgi:adenylate kinase|uniref:Adenylate kinase family protein n=3 Tax=Candidatus Aramenus sulfurataquae TaxID=1326980 RepID=A0ACC6TPX7_9CREN|nr:MAG: nucleotide kinase-like protein [Candidatus Aramenus sulfurataquae]MCL7344318.1 adenylate kinase family protein [Candidatus Aramenus sulfurataquae]
MIILVSGTPGVGKTTVAMEIAKRYNLSYFSVSQFIIENKLYVSYDEERQTYNIDDSVIEKVNMEVERLRNVVVETIYPSLLDRADKVIVLRKNPLKLYEELKRRKWNDLKVAENVEAEILGVVSQEAKDWFQSVCEIDVSEKTIDEVISMVEKGECDKDVDWLSSPEVEDLLLKLDKIITSHDNVYHNEQ